MARKAEKNIYIYGIYIKDKKIWSLDYNDIVYIERKVSAETTYIYFTFLNLISS